MRKIKIDNTIKVWWQIGRAVACNRNRIIQLFFVLHNCKITKLQRLLYATCNFFIAKPNHLSIWESRQRKTYDDALLCELSIKYFISILKHTSGGIWGCFDDQSIVPVGSNEL